MRQSSLRHTRILCSVTDPVCSGSSNSKILRLDSLPALASPNCGIHPDVGVSGVDLFNVSCNEMGINLWYSILLSPSDYQNEAAGLFFLYICSTLQCHSQLGYIVLI